MTEENGAEKHAACLRDAVSGIWCATLGVDHVSPEDDFFLSGGDSAQAVETAISLRALTGTELDLDVLYQYSQFGKLLSFLTEPKPGREQRPLTPGRGKPLVRGAAAPRLGAVQHRCALSVPGTPRRAAAA